MNTFEWTYVSELQPGDCLSDGSRVTSTEWVSKRSISVVHDNHQRSNYKPTSSVRVWDYPPTLVDLVANVRKERYPEW